MRIARDEEWEPGVQEMAKQGILDVRLISSESALRILEDALDGNHEAKYLLLAMNDCVDNLVARGSTTQPTRCVCCARPLQKMHPSALFCLAMPDGVPTPKAALAGAICELCSQTPDLTTRVVDVFREIWPNVSRIHLTHPPGHA